MPLSPRSTTMTAAYKIRKLDSRFNGAGCFTHMVEYTGRLPDCKVSFLQHRQWFWETFGPSSELELHHLLPQSYVEASWSWQTSHNQIRIYLNEKEPAWFKIKWS